MIRFLNIIIMFLIKIYIINLLGVKLLKVCLRDFEVEKSFKEDWSLNLILVNKNINDELLI